jgi:hypothetical protein
LSVVANAAGAAARTPRFRPVPATHALNAGEGLLFTVASLGGHRLEDPVSTGLANGAAGVSGSAADGAVLLGVYCTGWERPFLITGLSLAAA